MEGRLRHPNGKPTKGKLTPRHPHPLHRHLARRARILERPILQGPLPRPRMQTWIPIRLLPFPRQRLPRQPFLTHHPLPPALDNRRALAPPHQPPCRPHLHRRQPRGRGRLSGPPRLRTPRRPRWCHFRRRLVMDRRPRRRHPFFPRKQTPHRTHRR